MTDGGEMNAVLSKIIIIIIYLVLSLHNKSRKADANNNDIYC